MKDLYKILGVDKEADQEAIKAAYRKLSKQYHPDINKEPNAESMFKEISVAYEILSDESKRKRYDSGETDLDFDVNNESIKFLMSIFNDMMNNLSKFDSRYLKMELVSKTNDFKQELSLQRKVTAGDISKLNKMIDRMKPSEGSVNIFNMAIEQKINIIKRQRGVIAKNLLVIRKAKSILKKYNENFTPQQLFQDFVVTDYLGNNNYRVKPAVESFK